MLHKKIAFILGITLFFLTGKAAAQNTPAPGDMQRMSVMEDTLLVIADSMYNGYVPEERIAYCERFVKQLVTALKTPDSYAYPFTRLKDKINIIIPDDNSFRIFNWDIPLSELTRRYYGAVQMQSEQLKLYGLVDYSTELGKEAEDSILTGGKWFGAAYYNILTREINGRKIYTLFGTNASSPLSSKKVLEPMTITPSGVMFGAPIFYVKSGNGLRGKRVNRFVLEYKRGVQVMLNWNQDEQMILMDRLVSQINDPNRKYTFVPSGEYDGFRWTGNGWNYVEETMPAVNLGDGQAPSGKEPVR